jgi:hypothetical protein
VRRQALAGTIQAVRVEAAFDGAQLHGSRVVQIADAWGTSWLPSGDA